MKTYSQDSILSKRPLTILERASTTSGSIIKKDFYKITELRGLEIDVLTITTNNNIVTKGMFLTGSASSMLTTSRTYSVYLDKIEIDDLVKYLELIKELLSTKEPKNNTEYNFNTTGNFQAYLYNAQGPYGNNWHYGFDLDRIFTGGQFEFKEKDIYKILDAFREAKMKLQSE